MDNMKLLVADDSPVFREAVIQGLSGQSANIVTAVNGTQALELAQETRPDVILLDVLMPGMDGFEVCKALRQNETTRNAVIIILSSKDQFSDKLRGYEAGADDYLTKPVNFRLLSARVQRYLEGLQAKSPA